MGCVHFSVDGPIATIELDNPGAHNAVDAPMRAGLEEAYARVEADDAIRVAVIRGHSTGSFCAGGSIDGYLEKGAFGPASDGVPKIPRPYPARKPYIAAMLGYALGGGFALALACDLRVAGCSAKMGPTGLKFGAVQGAQTISRLTRLLGASRALGVLLMSKRLDAEEAERIGLVHQLTEDGDVFDRAREMANVIAGFDPWSIAETKRLVYETMHLPLDQSISAEDAVAAEGYRRPEALAAFSAFKEKKS